MPVLGLGGWIVSLGTSSEAWWSCNQLLQHTHCTAGSCNSHSFPIFQSGRHHTQAFTMAMSFEDVDVEAVAELSAKEVDEREVFEQEEKEQVEGVLDFFLGGGLSKVEISYSPSLSSSLMV